MNPVPFIWALAILFIVPLTGCGTAAAGDAASAYLRAKDLYLRGRSGEALALLEGRRTLRGFPPAAFLRGKILYLAGRSPEAESAWKDLLKIRPSHQETRKWLARLLLDDGRSSEAESVLAAALADDPEDPELLTLTGKARLRRGDTAGAVEYFTKAKTGLERAAEAPLELSDIYRAFGLRRRAAEELELAAALLGPDSALARETAELRRSLMEEEP